MIHFPRITSGLLHVALELEKYSGWEVTFESLLTVFAPDTGSLGKGLYESTLPICHFCWSTAAQIMANGL